MTTIRYFFLKKRGVSKREKRKKRILNYRAPGKGEKKFFSFFHKKKKIPVRCVEEQSRKERGKQLSRCFRQWWKRERKKGGKGKKDIYFTFFTKSSPSASLLAKKNRKGKKRGKGIAHTSPKGRGEKRPLFRGANCLRCFIAPRGGGERRANFSVKGRGGEPHLIKNVLP